jgi:hypothetical protein
VDPKIRAKIARIRLKIKRIDQVIAKLEEKLKEDKDGNFYKQLLMKS